MKVGYTYNHAGELTGVTGQGYAGVTKYASGMVYRASGGLKQMNYGTAGLSRWVTTIGCF